MRSSKFIKQLKIFFIAFLITIIFSMPTKNDQFYHSELANIPIGWIPIKFLTENIGNLDFSCSKKYNYKLCKIDVETAEAAFPVARKGHRFVVAAHYR